MIDSENKPIKASIRDSSIDVELSERNEQDVVLDL